ncbi:MAG: ATP-grasp domain-containing protein [Candidatus Helarchaeota archaeon]
MSNVSSESMLFPEGFAMLSAVVEDFRSADEEIIITLDSRLKNLKDNLRAQQIINIGEGEFEVIFEKIINDVDAILLIAPESGNILYDLAKKVEKSGKKLIGPSSNAIRIATDKTKTHKQALDAHVLVPSAIRVAFSEKLPLIDKICRQIGYPVVFKPIDGVGGAGVCIIAHQQDINAGIQTVQQETQLDVFQIQKLINGLDLSVSAIATDTKVLPLSLNAQLVRLGSPGDLSEYRGGYLPIAHTLQEEAFENSQKILKSIEGAHGYLGLDFVFSYAPFLIEINPRITTSYLGLREVLTQNPARLILDSINGTLPKKITLKGATVFSKVEFSETIQSIDVPPAFQSKIKLGTPPFPFKGRIITFIVAKAPSIQEAQITLTNFITYIKNNQSHSN